MDIFKQDWNKQMKTNPFVNKLLNNYPVDYNNTYVYQSGTFERGYGIVDDHMSFITTAPAGPFPTHLSVLPEKDEDRHDYGRYILPNSINEIQGRTEKKFHANTRPFSLYNLKYATLR